MTGLQINAFDYSVLDKDEKLATLENEKKLDEIFERYQPEVGEILYNQQQVMSKHGNGIFQEWYESKGFNRGKVYQYINKYKFLNNIEELSHKDIFINAPASLQNEMSKPSADREINQKVFDGDITTHKQYRSLEYDKKQIERAKQQVEKRADQLEEENDRLEEEIEEALNQEPEIREVVKKEIPEETQAELTSTKKQLEHSKKEMNKLQKELESYKLKDGDGYNEERAEKERKRLQWEAETNVLSLKIKVDNFLEDVAMTAFMEGAIAQADNKTREKITNSVEQLKSFTNKMDSVLKGRIEL